MDKVKLRKSGEVYIPKNLTKILNIEVGDRLNIFLEGKKIVLTSKAGFDKENKCTYNQKGTIHIPAEIRRLNNINPNAFLLLLSMKRKNGFALCLI